MNIEEYLKKNYKNIDMNILVDLFFKEKYFYTLIYPQSIPKRSEYLIQEIDKDIVGLVFTSKAKLQEYKKQEPLVSNWIEKQYETNNFEQYFKDVNKSIKGICINYPFYWCKLMLQM